MKLAEHFPLVMFKHKQFFTLFTEFLILQNVLCDRDIFDNNRPYLINKLVRENTYFTLIISSYKEYKLTKLKQNNITGIIYQFYGQIQSKWHLYLVSCINTFMHL